MLKQLHKEAEVTDGAVSILDHLRIKDALDVVVDLAQAGMTMRCVTHEMGFARTVAD
jgi:ABC-type polar amino acid transport system ATPase subunit